MHGKNYQVVLYKFIRTLYNRALELQVILLYYNNLLKKYLFFRHYRSFGIEHAYLFMKKPDAAEYAHKIRS